jgi:general stress protein 26
MNAPDTTPRRLDDLLDGGTVVMLGTHSGMQDLDFRPLTVARVDGDRIDFLIDLRERWASQFSDGESVHLTLSDNRSNDWGHLVGTASISTDPALVDELWSPPAAAYFDDGKDTPGVAAFRVRVTAGRYWSAPSGRIGSLISMISAAVGGDRAAGEQGDVAL